MSIKNGFQAALLVSPEVSATNFKSSFSETGYLSSTVGSLIQKAPMTPKLKCFFFPSHDKELKEKVYCLRRNLLGRATESLIRRDQFFWSGIKPMQTQTKPERNRNERVSR